MATNLAQQNDRANNPAFQAVVAAAFWQIIPDVIGEAVGASINDGNTVVALTQPMIDKRHAWAVDFTRQPAYWIPKCAAMLAGETAILAIDAPAIPDDATVNSRARRLIHTLAGVKATES
jgi:hypothetical protein